MGNMNQIVPQQTAALIEQVVIKGDLSALSQADRVSYYETVCRSIGINPLTKPFEYLTLNGKLVLYARRDATDQLRALKGISVTAMTKEDRDGVFVVTVQVANAEGRTDMATGAVTVANLKGDALANALMKAETKAKRRATLSICGLGFLDETEIETVPDARPANGKRTMADIKANAKNKRDETGDRIPQDLSQITSLAELERYKSEVLTPDFISKLGTAQYAVEELVAQREAELASQEMAVDFEDTLEPGEFTKADYIRDCHKAIDGFTAEPALLAWWNSKDEKTARREYALAKEELQGLMARVMTRREEILKANADAVLT